MNRILAGIVALAALLGLAGCSNGSDDDGRAYQERLPIVFVHGQYGSAQQFETHAMRFASNGYPAELLYTFEYDTGQTSNPIADLDSFIDGVLRETGARQVYAIGHSRGTTVWTTYLEDPAFNGAAKVAKYVNIDGRSLEHLPGGVPTIGIWGEWSSADSGYNRREDNGNAQIGPDPADNFYFPGKSHTETATAPETFALIYKFLTGVEARTTDVLAVKSGKVNVAGRVVYFPENAGYAGATLQVWKIDQATGQRSAAKPVDSIVLDPSGHFGPLRLEPRKYYEFALLREATDAFPVASIHHFYTEPFTRDDLFVRLLSTRPGESFEAIIPRQEEATGFVIQRQREFWGDQGANSDELFINGLNVLTPAISPRTGANLALFIFDQGSDNITDLDKGEIPPFNALIFFSGADVFIPATYGGTGTVELSLVTRGGGTSVLNVPDWPSSSHRVSIIFRDDVP